MSPRILRRRQPPTVDETRLFNLTECRLIAEVAFQAGREVGWRGGQQLEIAARRDRTYLILSELEGLRTAYGMQGCVAEELALERAIDRLHDVFDPKKEAAPERRGW